MNLLLILLDILVIEIIIYMILAIVSKGSLFETLLEGVINLVTPSPPSNEEVEEYEKPNYDIQEFNKRIERLRQELTMDKNGLYDIVDEDDIEFTGTEIISDSLEVQLDRNI